MARPGGPDIYENTAVTNWHAVARNSSFIGIRTQYGAREDYKATEHFHGATSVGLDIQIAYPYIRQGMPILAQAALYIKVVTPHLKPGLILSIDAEEAISQQQVDFFCSHVANHFPRQPKVAYCGSKWREQGLVVPVGWDIWLPDYGPLAGLRRYLPRTHRVRRASRRSKLRFWQHSDGNVGPSPRNVAGIQGGVDTNFYMAGDEHALRQWAHV